jgi:gamma-glutamyltranspeptidase/glutathione hydrolase
MLTTHRNQTTGFRSQRSMAMGRHGMACTSQPLATEAAVGILRRGGNAVDAAVAAAAMLGVVEPFSTGIGGDCFLLLWSAREQRLFGLNGSGRAPAALRLDLLQARGCSTMPMHGMLPVTVPGAVQAWADALQRFGSLPLSEVLAPAIATARNGFPVTEIIAQQWDLIVRFGVLQHADAQRTFTIDGQAPRLGQIFRNPNLAGSMEAIARDGADGFYRGDLAEKLVAFSNANDGVLSLADLAAHTSSWVEPILTSYRGYDVAEIPPNGQGLAALIGLNILENFELGGEGAESAHDLHLRIEAVKLAFADRGRYIADPQHANVPTAALLSKDYAQGRAALIHPDRALKHVQPGQAPAGTDTVYLTTADRDGNVVSFINSLYMPFGSGLVAGDTGIVLQNRGFGFAIEPGHPNCVAPGKRPFHTIIPGMLLKGGRPLVSFGVMGGDHQAQAHVQVVSNLVDWGLNIQEALDYPRFHYLEADRVVLEPEYGAEMIRALRERGHDVQEGDAFVQRGTFGGGQGIVIDPATGAYWGGSDRRKDGCALGF